MILTSVPKLGLCCVHIYSKRQCNDVLRKRISMCGGCVDQILVPKTAITIIIVGNESDEKREHKHIRRLCCWKWKRHSNM